MTDYNDDCAAELGIQRATPEHLKAFAANITDVAHNHLSDVLGKWDESIHMVRPDGGLGQIIYIAGSGFGCVLPKISYSQLLLKLAEQTLTNGAKGICDCLRSNPTLCIDEYGSEADELGAAAWKVCDEFGDAIHAFREKQATA